MEEDEDEVELEAEDEDDDDELEAEEEEEGAEEGDDEEDELPDLAFLKAILTRAGSPGRSIVLWGSKDSNQERGICPCWSCVMTVTRVLGGSLLRTATRSLPCADTC